MGGMNSRNHIMFGSVSSYFYRHVCGIDVPRGSKGYDSVSIRPVGVGTPGADLTSAECEVSSPRGPVKSSWHGPAVPAASPIGNSKPEVRLSVTIPVGSAGSVRVPLVSKVGLTPTTATILEGTTPVWKGGKFVAGVAGISKASADQDGVIFMTMSGSYDFVAELPEVAAL